MASDQTAASEAAAAALAQLGDSIDNPTFEQILEMDDEEEDREFSRGIVFGFFDQVTATFDNMDKAIESRKLEELSDLGHFLKGSSATLGLTHMKNSCEKIQHWGKCTDETGTYAEKPDKCIEFIDAETAKLKKEYERVSVGLRKFYAKPASP